VDISLVGRIDPGPSGKFRYVTSSVRSPLLNPQTAASSPKS